MVDKQCWRILKSQNSLLAQGYKSCYFQMGLFLFVGSRSSPFWAWIVFLWVRWILTIGLHRKVHWDHQISIWNDPWSSIPPYFKPITHNVDGVGWISELIDPSMGNWNIQHVCHFFALKMWQLYYKVQLFLSSLVIPITHMVFIWRILSIQLFVRFLVDHFSGAW